jgi:excinuclease UvrABC ATPase subunit
MHYTVTKVVGVFVHFRAPLHAPLPDSAGTAFMRRRNDVCTDKWKETFKIQQQVWSWMILFEEPVPNLFSFNPFGACPVCEGFSMVLGLDHDLVATWHRLVFTRASLRHGKNEKTKPLEKKTLFVQQNSLIFSSYTHHGFNDAIKRFVER